MCLAIPGQVLEISGDDPLVRMGRVSFGGIVKKVSLALVPEARRDDYVLVHTGVAITVLDESEANRTFEYLDAIGELDELETADDEIPG
jgi:hydrogenase expression/formation protein HypC